jgi:hypothetical protein
MNTSKLRSLESAVRIAQQIFANAIISRWPAGSPIQCRLSSGQLRATHATVLHASGDGRITVRLDTKNRRGYQTIKHVHWTNVISP